MADGIVMETYRRVVAIPNWLPVRPISSGIPAMFAFPRLLLSRLDIMYKMPMPKMAYSYSSGEESVESEFKGSNSSKGK
jgi:hypothetical protein